MNRFNNPFADALKDFKPVKIEESEETEPIGETEPVRPKEESANKSINTVEPKQPEKMPDQPWRHPETGLLKQDQEAFETLCQIIGLTRKGGREKMYWRVRDCFLGSHDNDVSYEINRWLGSETQPLIGSNTPREVYLPMAEKAEKVRAIVEPLLKRGHEARAVKWLLSTTPEKMRYGNGSRELRLYEAKTSAEKADKTIEEIAKAHGLEHLLV